MTWSTSLIMWIYITFLISTISWATIFDSIYMLFCLINIYLYVNHMMFMLTVISTPTIKFTKISPSRSRSINRMQLKMCFNISVPISHYHPSKPRPINNKQLSEIFLTNFTATDKCLNFVILAWYDSKLVNHRFNFLINWLFKNNQAGYGEHCGPATKRSPHPKRSHRWRQEKERHRDVSCHADHNQR